MADEPAGTRPGEHDGVHAWIAVDAVHQLVEPVRDVQAEQAVLAAVDPHGQHSSVVVYLEVACHRCASRRNGLYNEVTD